MIVFRTINYEFNACYFLSLSLDSVLDEERRQKENYVQKDNSDLYGDGNTILGELASTIADNSHRQYKRETFIVSNH